MIDVQNLTFAYPNQPSLFEGLCWSLAPGETWSVVGRSGCGKSTLLCLLYPIPKIIFLPIVLLSLGIGNAPKVFIIALALFFQVLLVVRERASNLRPELIVSVRSLGAGGARSYLPACPAL